MAVSAKEVQELRQISGAGMMECKSALSESGGDLNIAFKLLREKGIAKAEKKSSRDANEGLIGVKVSSGKASISFTDIAPIPGSLSNPPLGSFTNTLLASANSSNSESVIRSLSPPPADGTDAAGDSGVAVFSGSSGAGASGLFDADESPGLPFP